MKRPELKIYLQPEKFKSFYYLKSELIAFCKEYGLQTAGSKEILNNRIAHYLSTGEKLTSKSLSKKSSLTTTLSLDSVVEKDFVCSQNHRAFFKEVLGNNFTFNVDFMTWLKENEGKSYDDAVKAYKEILKAKKTTRTTISKQFEYNTYIRDFFADNTGKTLSDAIVCWKYKKSLPGHNRYEASDRFLGK